MTKNILHLTLKKDNNHFNCIYLIRFEGVDKVYIGSCKNFNKRIWVHLSDFRIKKHSNKEMQDLFNNFGIEKLRLEIIEENIEGSKLLERESYYIGIYKNSTNLCRFGKSHLGIKQTEEVKEKIRKSLLGRKYSPERRNNMSIHRKGVKPKPFTEQHRLNISNSLKGIKRGHSKHCKEVMQLKDNNIINKFPSIKIASETVGCSRALIILALQGKIKQAKGYNWRLA